MIEFGKVTRIASVFVVMAVLAGTLQAQEMYKWTDENGVVHFSDKKPAGRDVKAQNVPSGPPLQGANPYATEPVDEASPGQQKRDEIASSKRQVREQEQKKQAQCANWQSEVDRLEPNRRVFYENERGETVRMDDVERVNQVAELKSQIARYCK